MKIIAFLFFISIYNISSGQQDSPAVNFPAFSEYIFNILEDTTNHWSEYPKPPRVTENVLQGMESELENDDSAGFYLEKLSFAQYRSHTEEEDAFRFLNKSDYTYCILGLAGHWNPDISLKALLMLNRNLSIRPLINSVKMRNGEWKKFDKIAIGFLAYLLESNPLFIAGSENSTIHGNYISNILWDLDLLTGENIADKKQVSEWYKNDLQFDADILKWRSHEK